MLLLASAMSGRAPAVVGMARELRLGVGCFRDAAALERLLDEPLRRIVLMTQRDLNAANVAVLARAAGRTPFGLIVAASREALRLRDQDALLDDLQALDNVAWLGMRYSAAELMQAARACRRGLLRISRAELEQAIDAGQFTLHYQPKVERSGAREWRTREAEALLRWQHPEHGLLSPLEFLPELDEFGLTIRTGEFVLHAVAAQLEAWRTRGLHLNACINLASGLLADPGLPETYAGIVAERGLTCERFTFEVIERDIADSEAPHLRTLTELRQRGFRISVDDFGIASASLGTLEQLPVDEIKIHPAALARARGSDVGRTILAAVTGLAHNLGIAVCAEGVEDAATYEFLQTIECDKMQGYLISAAVPPEVVQDTYDAGKRIGAVA